MKTMNEIRVEIPHRIQIQVFDDVINHHIAVALVVLDDLGVAIRWPTWTTSTADASPKGHHR